MEKAKKERQEKELRQTLKTILTLAPHLLTEEKQTHSQLLAKTYPRIAEVNTLRILTILQIIYLLELYLQLIEKNCPNFIGQFRIGIIGGGITARLLLNSILPLSRDGLSLKNITVSTRQVQNFKLYQQNFGIRVVFNNQETARTSDFLVVATPATLDNWIVTDLRQPLEARIKNSDSNFKELASTNKLITEKSQMGSSMVDPTKKLQSSNVGSNISEPTRQERRIYKPLVYILTSDFSQQKCKRLFHYPVLTPSIRAKDIPAISQTLKVYSQQGPSIDLYQKLLAWWLTKQSQHKPTTPLQSHGSRVEINSSQQSQIELIIKYLKTPIMRIIDILAFVIGSTVNNTSLSSSVSNTVSISELNRDRKREEAASQILQLVTAHGEVDATLLKKTKKWRMAYNNFMAC